ncbi:alanine racemase [Paucilactobacillus suebicus]|uniref:Alanine racemase n=1 Tax=Paucilactobacillus suebicus DSM 5007 = KCTC 3549 TaxID=1423807 RepID=A0A0R1W384_9LACO|nr:alanine racemase [Paucilactobacillus suebicus]KRM09750.1 alanine racemase [Paucilactobacillus suebicus DSM 5007 = KCTC 3549]
MVVGTNRPTKLIIDRQAIKNNIVNQQAKLNDGTEIFAVVKANAYGHGLVGTAYTALSAGATGLCVAILDEGLELRRAGITEPILVLGITEPEQAALAIENDISLTVGSLEWFKRYREIQSNGDVLKVHIALDTGMGRIGFRDTDELSKALNVVQGEDFNFEGIFTHFATADEQNHDYFIHQYDQWKKLISVVNPLPKYVHVSNSATGLWHTNIAGNMVRMGISLYGLNPSGKVLTPTMNLQPALSLVSHLDFVKQLHKGESVSYGATYQAAKNEWIGTIPLGYADGYPRAMQGFHVIIDGGFCEIVGRVCMDQLMIRLPRKLNIGTKVTLIGNDGDKSISATDIADYVGTINYEILTGLSDRIVRKYIN